MPRHLLYLIVFIEGFCSLGAEVIALRRLVPHVGSSIVITAPTIGLFLLALALGYASGAKVSERFTAVVARNFLLSALLVGLGLARVMVDGLFAHLQPAGVAYVLFIGGVLCPVAWLLGQTVPVLTNLMKHMRTGEASGYALYWSTLGSFLGSVSLSLLVMQWLGVSVAVLACALLLAVGSLLLAEAGWRRWGTAVAVGLVATAINLFAPSAVVDTAYADYAVEGVSLPEHADPRAFFVNNSLASLVDDSTPPRYARYVQHLRKLLLEDLAFKGRSVLVLGAGGFTLSHQEPVNRYTYVDIDPKIREIAETRFLRAPIRGEFVVDDARRYVRATAERYDAVVVDVFSSHTSIPGHLVTREFWQDTRRALAPDGVLLANLILDGKLETPYARNLLATIESVFGRCGVDVLHRGKPLSNVVVSCYASSQPGAITPYSDERNGADLDLARSR
ncbi:fused MFS/spermidine synthase [Zoogloea sp.]|uniref:fused MFS/spermidine synthase n=1 Tax=Zoogloea sp. TaxID=49181 RepID=UPI0025E0D4DE|nr:fused MFS/spermidine synthase [Zoogloea sp.]MCK6395942.1 fused MFS/spermidine synthase [Zoogloea sp.]